MLIMQSYLVGNGCHHFRTIWHFLVMGIVFGHVPAESWDVSVINHQFVGFVTWVIGCRRCSCHWFGYGVSLVGLEI